MKRYFILLSLQLTIATTSYTTANAQPVNTNDSLALVDLYNSTNGLGWRNSYGWLTADPVSDWYGITVTGTRVTKIYLAFNNLQGSIPTSIGYLSSLKQLILRGNQLNGIIPSSIGKLTNLKTLELWENQLSGTIPSTISNLLNLDTLYLFNNQLSGSIPSSIGNLVNLTHLGLFENRLTGAIPSTIGNLIGLEYLNLDNNQLTGSIPSTIGNLVNLIYLDFTYNQLSGSIPSSIGQLVTLSELFLGFNQLSGTIPASIGNLANLVDVNLNSNQLTGAIPHSFRYLKHLSTLFLSNNQLAQPHNGDFPIAYQKKKYIFVENNCSTFNGLEFLARRFRNVYYTPQAIIPIYRNGNTLSVYAGGTLSNNAYKWFRVGDTDSTTIIGDSTFTPPQDGQYYVKVTNAIATELTLYSDTVHFTADNSIVSTASAMNADNNAGKALQVYPNSANSRIIIMTGSIADVLLINSTGKVVLTKTINGKEDININSFAPGTYYVQNKTTGEVKKIVVVR